jgi:hypothetical protein
LYRYAEVGDASSDIYPDNYVVGEVSMNGYKTGSALGYTKATFTALDETKLKDTLAAMSGFPLASSITLTVADGDKEGVVVSYVMVTADATAAAAAQRKIRAIGRTWPMSGGFQALLKISFPLVYGGATITAEVAEPRVSYLDTYDADLNGVTWWGRCKLKYVESDWFQTLTLEYQSWFQNVPFNFNLRHYNLEELLQHEHLHR